MFKRKKTKCANCHKTIVLGSTLSEYQPGWVHPGIGTQYRELPHYSVICRPGRGMTDTQEWFTQNAARPWWQRTYH